MYLDSGTLSTCRFDLSTGKPGAGSQRPPENLPAGKVPVGDGLQGALPTLLSFSALLEELRLRKAALAKAGSDAASIRGNVLQFIAERALTISGASGIAIALAEAGEIVCRGTAGETAPPLGLKLSLQSGLTAVCYLTGTIVRCDDSETDTRVDREACRELGIRSVVAVPMRTPLGVGGLIEAFEKEAYAFTDSDVRELSLLAELTVEAIRADAPAPAKVALPAKTPPATVAQPPADRSSVDRSSVDRSSVDRSNAPVESPGKVPAKDVAPKVSNPVWSGVPDNDLTGQSTSLADWTQLTGSPENAPSMAPSVAGPENLVTRAVPAAGRQSAPAAAREPSQPWRRSWTPGALVATALVAAASTGWWWHSRRAEPAATAVVQPAATVTPLSAAQVAANSALPRITGLRHWASAESSTVVIDLQDQVQYEAHRFLSPDRIDVDLHDTALVKELIDKEEAVDDPLLSRIKIGQSIPGVSRVELDTRNSPNFSVSLEANPYRLVLEMRSPLAPPKPKMDTQAVQRSVPHPSFPEISPNSTTEDAKLRAQVPHLRVVVDAGHGGWDMGTVGRQGLLEKDLALEIAQRLGVLLEQRLGLEVVYTRTDDTFVPLGRRAAIANQVGADLFISVHANYSSLPSARGVETYYTADGPSTQVLAEEEKEVGSAPALQMAAADLKNKSNASRKLATSVQQSLYGSLAAKGPGVRNRGVKAASFVVLTGTAMPAILAEVSFVSSPADEHNLQDPFYRQNIAEALYRGVARYAASSSKTNVASASKRNTGL
jgi:N-acetylmuramoyl-L-alanine amidase